MRLSKARYEFIEKRLLVRDSIVVRSNEWSSNLQEVIEFSVSIDGWSSSLSSESSNAVSVDFHHSILRDLCSFADSLLLLIDSALEVLDHLVLKRKLAACSNSFVFRLSLKHPEVILSYLLATS